MTPPISGQTSKRILWAISRNLPIDSIVLPEGIAKEQLAQLQELYKQQLKENEIQHNQPRNYIFYNIIKNKLPSFSWELREKNIIFNMPTKNGLELSLLSLLLQRIEFDDNTWTQRYSSLNILPQSLVHELTVLFEKIQVIHPHRDTMEHIVKWLQVGLQGKTLYTFSPACPDYSVEVTGDPERPFRHTFDTIGSGVGLIAKRILDVLPAIKATLEKFGINFIPVLAMADYEALSISNLTRLNISFNDFSTRTESSRKLFKDTCSIFIETPNITELCNGYENWKNLVAGFKDRFAKYDFGSAKLNRKNLLDMAKARQQLYARWHGDKNNTAEYLPVLLDQGAEYAAIGKIVANRRKNCH